MKISIHVSEDPESVHEHFKILMKNWDYWPWEDLSEALQTGNYTLFCAENQHETLAALLIMTGGDFADVVYLYSSPAFRRRNLALRLLQECERVLEERKFQKLFLEVRKDNIPAQNLYEVFGMKVLNIRHRYYPDGCDGLVYYKELTCDFE